MRGSNCAIVVVAISAVLQAGAAHAQGSPQRIALKSGESADLFPAYWVVNCRSTVVGLPEVEILEGSPELTVSIREEMVLPRRQACPNRVPGGTVVVTAKDVKEPKEVRITYRLKFKTKDGPRQTAHVYTVSLFP